MTVQTSYYQKAVRAEEKINALVSLRTATPSDLHRKYRLLAPSSMYLVASHFVKDSATVVWSLTTKWEMFKIFNKALTSVQNPVPEKMMTAIDAAILDQRKIARLKKLYAVLLDPGKQQSEKTSAYKRIEQEDKTFFNEIKHCIWAAHGAKEDAGIDFSDRKIDSEPADAKQVAVIKKMMWILKNGYSDCKEHETLFENI